MDNSCLQHEIEKSIPLHTMYVELSDKRGCTFRLQRSFIYFFPPTRFIFVFSSALTLFFFFNFHVYVSFFVFIRELMLLLLPHSFHFCEISVTSSGFHVFRLNNSEPEPLMVMWEYLLVLSLYLCHCHSCVFWADWSVRFILIAMRSFYHSDVQFACDFPSPRCAFHI